MKLSQIPKAIRYYGLRRLIFRLGYVLALRSGRLKQRFPAFRWQDAKIDSLLQKDVLSGSQGYKRYKTNNLKPFFFDSKRMRALEISDKESICAWANRIIDGQLTYFSAASVSFKAGDDWHRNPFTNQSSTKHRHWTELADFAPEQGDIKYIWEPSRFGWAYPLVRAYAITGDEKYVEHFWQWFEDWCRHNQPNLGANYKCGQECAIRSLAVCFALYAFAACKATTKSRFSLAAQFLAVHAERIAGNISYALYQNNNHAVSEANGLYTIGTLFPEFRQAVKWRKKGKNILAQCALSQIFADGSYIQHSMNYHRFMLQHYVWALRLAQLNGDAFNEAVVERVKRAKDFLYQMQDKDTGRLCNYGSNDGASLFFLNSCDYLDYRPVISAAHYLFTGKRLYEEGPWNEDLQWFFGQDALSAPADNLLRESKRFDFGGYYTVREKESWAMTRCHTYLTRPGHADMLTIDLWYNGVNILRDSGSYRYYCSSPWQNYFSSTRAHNCVQVNQADQMTQGTRFMWFDWVKSQLDYFGEKNKGLIKIFQGRHFGYRADNVVIRRTIISLFHGRQWLMVDDVLGRGEKDVTLPWHLGNRKWEVIPQGLKGEINDRPVYLYVWPATQQGKHELFYGDTVHSWGWESLYYGVKIEAPVFMFSGRFLLPMRIFTFLSLGSCPEIKKINDTCIQWQSGPNGYMLRFNAASSDATCVFESFAQT